MGHQHRGITLTFRVSFANHSWDIPLQGGRELAYVMPLDGSHKSQILGMLSFVPNGREQGPHLFEEWEQVPPSSHPSHREAYDEPTGWVQRPLAAGKRKRGREP